MPTPPRLPNAQRSDWWTRNWKWCVPVLIITSVLLIAGSIYSVFGLLKSSDPYVQAVARTKASPAVTSALGTPVTEGFFTTGRINFSGGSGNAQLAIPMSGPKGNATVYVIAQQTVGQWHFSALIVHIESTGKRIDLSDQ